MKTKLRSLIALTLVVATVLSLAVSCGKKPPKNPPEGVDSYSITYVLNGGENNKKNPSYYTVGDVALADPKKSGYDFVGWYADEYFETPVSVIYASEMKDVTVYAKWSDIPSGARRITYELNGGTNNSANPDYVLDKNVTLVNPTKPAFDFLGWYADEALTIPVTEISKNEKSDVTVYAKWSEAKLDALIYNANGGIGYGTMVDMAQGETVTLSDTAFSKNGYRFVGWSDSPVGEAIYAAGDEYTLTESSPRVLYAVWDEIRGADKSIELSVDIDYTPYYVQDNLQLSVDFFGVTPDRNRTNPLIGGADYENVAATAGSRFGAIASNYVSFVNYAGASLGVSGGTAKIASPWCFEDWYADYTRKMGSGSVADYRTSLPSGDNVKSVASEGNMHYVTYIDDTEQVYKTSAQSDTTFYITNTVVEGVTDYYIQNGKWAKKTYVSEWSDNSITLGVNSTLFIDGLQAYVKTGIEDYTVQAITSFETENASGQVYMLGMARYSVGAVTVDGEKKLSYRGMTKSHNGSGSTSATLESFVTDADWYGINDNTFTFDRNYSDANGAGNTTYGIFVNGAKYATVTHETSSIDGVTKIGEGQNTKVYAVRVYSDILTEDEIAQNHFVDIAKFYGLNLTQYAYATEQVKASVHASFIDRKFEGENAVELQSLLDSFFEADSYDGLSYVIFKANYGPFDTAAEQYVVNGSPMPTPDMVLGGSEFLGWAYTANGEVVYPAGETVAVSESTELYAVWEHKSYSISYDTQGGELADSASLATSYISNTDVIDLPTPAKEGYIFCGWYTSDKFDKVIEKITYGVGGDLTLYAGWAQDAKNLFELNLSDTLESRVGKYDTDFTNNANVLDKFLQAVDELPEEVTVLPRFDVNSYLVSNQTQLYVSPEGDDANAGTIDAPLKTLNTALSRVRGTGGAIIWVREGEYHLSSPVSINATHSGTAISPLIISAYGNETPTFSTVKSIAPSDFTTVDYANDALASRIPATAQANIRYVNVRELGWTESDMGAISTSGTPTLFINGEAQNIARYPNAGEELLYITTVYDTGSVTSRDGSWIYQWWIPRVQNWVKWSEANGASYNWDVTYYNQQKNKTLHLYESEAAAIADAKAIQAAVDAGARVYTDSYGNKNVDYGWTIGMIDFAPCLWENDGNIWYYGNLFEGWEHGYYNVKEFNVPKRSISSVGGSVYGAAVSGNSPTGHNDYYLFNAIEALDAPGEWFMNFETGDLYIYGTENFENAKITYASTNEIHAINASSAEFIIINGLTVDETSGNGIHLYNSNNMVVQNCTVKNAGGEGIYLGTCKNCAVIYNDVSLVDGNMISLNHSAAAYALEPDKNVVQNNYCHEPKISKSSGISAGGCRSVISHNFLEDVRIQFSTSVECIIEYNEIRSGGKYESDAGMIYLNGFYHLGNHIRYNYLYDWGTPGNGVYFDDLSSFNYAYYNIMDSSEKTHEKATGFCYTSTGHYNVFYGNVFIGRSVDRINESAIYFNDKAWLGYRWPGLSENFVNNYTSKYAQSALFSRFPELEVYLQKMATHVEERAMQGYVRNELEVYLRSPADNIVKNNVVVGTSVCFNQPDRIENGVALPSFDYVGENFHSKVADGIFVDCLNGDFTIYEDILEIIKTIIPDFKPLSTEKAGLTY